MKFTVSTKPLSDGLNLAIVNANVSKFYRKSCLAQLSVENNVLRINVEAAFILSEIRLKGSADSSECATVFVDSLLLKQLVATFDASTTTLEFTDTGLVLHSGKSKFSLPKLVDGDELSLDCPSAVTSSDSATASVSVDKSDWKFIKDNQMYAIAMSFIHPVYTKVWVGQDGHVLVGDFDSSLFTHSHKNKLGSTCLLSDTIINLFNSLPEGAKVTKLNNVYVIQVKTDGFEFISQFAPQYEEDENVGSYNSEIILSMMEHPTEDVVKVSAASITKFLNQADLLSNSTEDTITLNMSGNQIALKDKNVDCVIDVEGSCSDSYSIEFKTVLLKSVISNYSEDTIYISPMKQDDQAVGVVVWGKELTTLLAGVD